MLHAGDAGPLPFTLRWEQSQIWLPDASSGSPAGSSSHANPSEGQSGGAAALKQEGMCPSPPEFDPSCFFSVQGLFLNIIKAQEKKVLILSLQGLLLPSLPPVHCWLLCSGSPSGAKFICFSFSDSHSLIFFLGPHNHLISPCFLFPFPEREIGWTVAMEMLFRDSVQSSDVCFPVLPSIPSCYTRASTGYLSAYYLQCCFMAAP